jgi:hypothetical protein
MTDARESILQRIVAIAACIEGVRAVSRNVPSIGDDEGVAIPAVVILEGDEEAAETDPVNRGSPAPRIIRMYPQIVLYAGDKLADIGITLNTLRSRLINAILIDAELIALTMNHRGARYVAMESDLAFGRQMMGRMALRFEIPYRMLPSA